MTDVKLIDLRSLTQTHHREFEETRHGRRQHEEPPIFKLHVQQHSPGCQVFEYLQRLALRLFPIAGGGGNREGPDGKQCHQGRLLLREQHLENPEEQFGGRGSLGKQVDPFGEALVALLERDVRHGRELRGVQGAALHRELYRTAPRRDSATLRLWPPQTNKSCSQTAQRAFPSPPTSAWWRA